MSYLTRSFKQRWLLLVSADIDRLLKNKSFNNRCMLPGRAFVFHGCK